MELINLLISEHGARVGGPLATDGGATALQIASTKGYIGIVKRLLDVGSDVNEAPADHNGRTAWYGTAEHGRIDMLQMLLNEGVLIIGEGKPQYPKAVELVEKWASCCCKDVEVLERLSLSGPLSGLKKILSMVE